MRVLRGTLTFVLGMIIGIILFVVAIGGTVAILATQMTVGQIQQAVTGSDSIISSDSEIYDKTILDAVKDIVNDVQNFDSLSLKTLYEHYGIKLLNGISGIDFTDKDFYTVPITDLINDLSIVVNSFTLNDVSKIAGVDFSSYGLPILTDNLNNNLSTAMDNILGSLNGNLSIRDIKTDFGIDLGADDNELIATLQDVVLSEFGNVMNVLRVSSILEANTDTFIPQSSADRKYFVKTDVYQEIPASELASTNYTLGVETSLIGGLDTDGDGKADKMKTVETRYTRINDVTSSGEAPRYVVDNSSYGAEFDFENNNKTFYRHIVYTPTEQTTGENVYVLGYANRVDSVNGNDYTLVEKGFIPVSELEFSSDFWAMTGDVLDNDSKLGQLEDGQTADKIFERVQVGTSTTLLQSIAHMTVAELQNADNLLEGLTISDVIDITPDTAKIIKSLAMRNCKILELGTAANDLTLGEMIDITAYRYKVCESGALGKYVRIEDESSFTVFDKTNPEMVGATRYKKNSDGTYTQDPNGKFVHSVYYTLYNPAEHANLVRYNRVPVADGESVSSALLQRFAGATLGTFSDAFDALMLADVIQIDADVYEEIQIDIDNLDELGTERVFYYDSELNVYRVANTDYIKENPSLTYYHIAYSGDSASFMKKLAYAKIDTMADAMEVIVDDMMLSEFVDVYTENAVSLTNHSGNITADKKYFIEYGAGGNAYQAPDGTQYVYVYDLYGDYAKANYRPVDVTSNITENTVYYKYVKFTDMTGTDADKKAKETSLIASGNMYYLYKKDKDDPGEFKQNYALCMYMLTKTEYRSHVYYREAIDSSQAGTAGVYSGKIYGYTGSALPYGLYVKDDSILGYISYDEANPVFADRPLVTFEKSKSDSFNDLFFINKADAGFIETALKALAIKQGTTSDFHSEKIYFARRQCIDVYVLTDKTENTFVFVDGQYVKYDSEKHSDISERFEKKVGYIGEMNEVSYDDGTKSELALQDVSFIRERSASVLRMLARGTIGEMTSIITNATVGDIIEAEPGTMFDKDVIKNAKITELGTVFKDILTTMTIGELMTWSNVTDVQDSVKTALNGITIQRLFSSLVLDTETQEIKVDMLKIYGYNADYNT